MAARQPEACQRRGKLRFTAASAGPRRRSAQSARRRTAAHGNVPAVSEAQGPRRQGCRQRLWQGPLARRPHHLLGRRAGAVGRDRCRRAHRLGRHPFAADPVAGNSQAPALGSDSRRQRRDAGDARRNRRQFGRRRGAAARTAGLCAERLHRHRGSPLLFALRGRSAGHRARRLCRHPASRRRARRLDADAAARQKSVPDAGAHRQPQTPGSAAGVLAGAQILEAAHSRTLSQPRLFRRRRLRRRSGVAALFRQIGAAIDARRGRHAGRPGEIAVEARADAQSRRRRAPRATGHRRHARAEHDQRRCGARRARASGAGETSDRRRFGQLRRRLGDGRGQRPRRSRRDRPRHRHLDRSEPAECRRAGAGRHADAARRQVRHRPRRAGRHDSGRHRARARLAARTTAKASSTAPSRPSASRARRSSRSSISPRWNTA